MRFAIPKWFGISHILSKPGMAYFEIFSIKIINLQFVGFVTYSTRTIKVYFSQRWMGS